MVKITSSRKDSEINYHDGPWDFLFLQLIQLLIYATDDAEVATKANDYDDDNTIILNSASDDPKSHNHHLEIVITIST